jgi:hypothetical protein
MSRFIVEFDDIDWQLLSAQKAWLLEVGKTSEYDGDMTAAEGLINLLDYIQDAAEEQGQPVVWLTEEDDR